MNRILIVLFILILPTKSVTAQTSFPSFLCGSWKIENKETYEHWDMVNDRCLKGFLYEIKNGHPVILEYLDITDQKGNIAYTATVLNQNGGKPVTFILNQTDSLIYSFENPNHDFPKKIIYQQQSPSRILIKVSNGKQKEFSYYMIKLEATYEE